MPLGVDVAEEFAQQERAGVAEAEPLAAQEHRRGPQRPVEVAAQVAEDLAVVGAGPGERDDDRRAVGPSAGTAGSLEIVRLARRDVPHQDAREAADVDPQLQRRRRAEDVADAGTEEILESAILHRVELGAVLFGP